jgi:hypothetical protein
MKRRLLKRILLGIAAVVVVGALAYGVLVPTLLGNWGATPAEASEVLPGDELIPQPTDRTTMAITINAPAEQVFPWVAQIGQERGGLYSYEWFENLIGCDIHNADTIVPEWQMKVGDGLKLHPSMPPLTIAAIDPGNYMVVSAGTAGQVDASVWVFSVKKVDENTSRLIFRIQGWHPDQTSTAIYSVLNPGSTLMEQGMMNGIKERAEKSAV